MIHFKYRGEAVGKGRPRVTRRGGYIHTYTPEKTRLFEDAMRFELIASTCESMPIYPAETPLKAKVLIGMKVPKSYSKKKRERCLNGEIAPTKKPDIDNVLKSIFDALNGYAMSDDSQITEVIAEKIYSENPFVEVTIFEQREVDEAVQERQKDTV